MSLPSSVDIIIVGGGPTGLSAAASLLTSGVKDILVVDGREEHADQYSRALVIHPRTLEVTEAIGCSDRLVAAGEPVHGMRLNSSASGLLLKATISFLPSKYNYVLSIPQSETERILRERVKELGGNVVWNHKAVGLKEEADGTKVVTFESGDTVKTRYVIGADGNHSVVRQAAGIAYLDPFSKHPTGEDAASAEERFCLADVKFNQLSAALPGDFVTPVLHPDGAAVFIPLPKQEYRLVCEVRDADVAKAPPVEYFQKLLEERFPSQGMKITEMTWSSRFFIKYRLAEKYFVPHLPGSNVVGGPKGGIAIAGDAAHVHSPMGGQGMNLGMRDAIFLGQAIAADMASPDVSQPELTKWAEERRAAGKKVIMLTGNLTNFGSSMNSTGRLLTTLRDYAIWLVGLLPFVTRQIAWNMSGLGERPA